eukprot:437158_1
MTVTYVLVILLISCCIHVQPQLLPPGHHQIDTKLRNQLNTEFNKRFINPGSTNPEKPLLTSTVRNIFHDCAGQRTDTNGEKIIGCDGCINFQHTGHAGLWDRAMEPPILDYQGLEDIYLGLIPNRPHTWNEKLSRADFWALAATFSIEKAFLDANDPLLTLNEIPLWIGRTDTSDCSQSVDTPMPEATDGWSGTFDWFQTNFGFTERETVAIMGAHTLGFLNEEYSGFSSGPWVGGSSKWLLDGSYYKFLMNIGQTTDWTQRQAPNNKYEWFKVATGANAVKNGFIMLNADIGLWKDIESCNLQPDGQTSCSY